MNDSIRDNMPRRGYVNQEACGTASPECTVGLRQMTEKGCISVTLDVNAMHDFPEALQAAIRNGNRITRRGWNGSGQYVCAQRPHGEERLTAPYLYLRNVQGDYVAWAPSQGDMFAQDWAIIPIQPI